MKKMNQNTSVILGAALLSTLGAGASHAASSQSALFSAVDLDRGYMLEVGEGKCGEGKCGGDKDKKKDKGAEGKCGEGKDGKKKGAEGKCGEGKCGGTA